MMTSEQIAARLMCDVIGNPGSDAFFALDSVVSDAFREADDYGMGWEEGRELRATLSKSRLEDLEIAEREHDDHLDEISEAVQTLLDEFSERLGSLARGASMNDAELESHRLWKKCNDIINEAKRLKDWQRTPSKMPYEVRLTNGSLTGYRLHAEIRVHPCTYHTDEDIAEAEAFLMVESHPFKDATGQELDVTFTVLSPPLEEEE
jgi:hypothetical protein